MKTATKSPNPRATSSKDSSESQSLEGLAVHYNSPQTAKLVRRRDRVEEVNRAEPTTQVRKCGVREKYRLQGTDRTQTKSTSFNSIQLTQHSGLINTTITSAETTTSTMHCDGLSRRGVTELDAGVPLGLAARKRRF